MVQERLFFWLVEEIDKNWIRLVFVGGFDILHSSEHSSEHKRYVTLRRRTRSGDNQVFGLSSATELNGKAGLITGYDDERQRYIVKFDKFGEKALKAENICRASVISSLAEIGFGY